MTLDPFSDRRRIHHLRAGWWLLLVCLTLGITLEFMHGFKVRWYLDVSNETRRLMWTLAHAHGTLLSLVQIAFAGSAARFGASRQARGLASRFLMGATLLMPAGFFLGGVWTHAGDPGLGVVLVAPGGLMLFVAVALIALQLGSGRLAPNPSAGGKGEPAPNQDPAP